MNKNKIYKLFIMEDIFDLFTGGLISSKKITEGNIPRITATQNNNGIALFTDEINDKNFEKFDNFISISFLGDVFYQKNSVSLDMKIHGIKPKTKELNKYIAQFLIPLLRNFSLKYNYGNQLSMRLLKRQKINLPITDKESPDWQFMERIGKKLYQNQRENIKKDLMTKKIKLEKNLINKDIKLDNEVFEWKIFKIDEVFSDTQRGKRLTKANQIGGNIPYISSTSLNNGIDNFIGNTTDIRQSEYNLTIANSGSVGSTFYHDYPYIASDHVHSLTNKKFNKYHYLFI